jgi:hypothetical protein
VGATASGGGVLTTGIGASSVGCGGGAYCAGVSFEQLANANAPRMSGVARIVLVRN